ncbi:hypothetical protein, partial [Kitasatospora sp. NPDC056531]|uniref:hypothetical protein n=1 Tax=Kitasatospora sp. NPDC056531 TaxID=3345856 RepID=UPI00369C68F1
MDITQLLDQPGQDRLHGQVAWVREHLVGLVVSGVEQGHPHSVMVGSRWCPSFSPTFVGQAGSWKKQAGEVSCPGFRGVRDRVIKRPVGLAPVAPSTPVRT